MLDRLRGFLGLFHQDRPPGDVAVVKGLRSESAELK
jgi:hypothetical protein